MTQRHTLAFANYSAAGDCIGSEEIDLVAIDAELTADLTKRLSNLSGDLDLPLEENVCSDPPVVVRICSEFNAAYTVYYCDEVAAFASLILTGKDEEAELELMQAFKYLLLDDADDDEDPTEEAVEEILNSPDFQFDEHTARPIVYQIRLSDEPEDDDLSQRIADLDQSVAAAFLKIPQVKVLN